MQMKSDLRRELKNKRAHIQNKTEKDGLICRNFLNSEIYRSSAEILCYCSTGSEIDTSAIIHTSLRDAKKLFLPKCTDQNGNMTFYRVEDTNCLVKGAFGIYEPDDSFCPPAFEFCNAVCVVPGLAFDKNGNRLGYGKGYYDRFLEKFTIISAGLCYNELISDILPAEKHDLPVDYIFTDCSVIKV